MTRRSLCAAVAMVAALAGFSVPAAAERLVVSLSNHRVMVTSNFTGEELVLFGGIEQDGASRTRPGGYDIIVTVTGPRQTVVTKRGGAAPAALAPASSTENTASLQSASGVAKARTTCTSP